MCLEISRRFGDNQVVGISEKQQMCHQNVYFFFLSYLAEVSLFCMFQASFQRDRKTGLSTVKFNIEKRTSLNINDATCVILNVKLDCNVEETPWCDNPDSWHN